MTKVPRLSKKAEESIIAQAFDILFKRLNKSTCLLSTPAVVLDYLKVKLSQTEHEVFGIIFVDVKNRLIADEIMFSGTLNHTQVYPREVVKRALRLNAQAVILYHNHPGGEVSPSPMDLTLTKALRTSLATVDVKLLDHIIVAGVSTFSFSEGGLL